MFQLLCFIGIFLPFLDKAKALGDNTGLYYSRSELFKLQLNDPSRLCSDFLSSFDLPNDISRNLKTASYDSETKRRKRGKKGGVKQRCRKRGLKVPLPTVILGNARSIRNKSDELEGCVRFQHDYKDCCLIGLTETWLQNMDTDSIVDLTILRCDRENQEKKRGGGVCFYVNDRWCKNFKIIEKYCDSNIEILTVGLRPCYLPREFNYIISTIVYIPPDGNFNSATETLADSIHKSEEKHPDAVKLLMGDFNNLKFNNHVFQQYVNFPTRDDRTLFYCNIKNGYTAKKKPPLGNSDHVMIHLLPIYKQILKSSKPIVMNIKKWSPDIIDSLRGCFECTDWSVLTENESDFDADVITEYINFCVECNLPTKSVKSFPNNKPWVTKDLKTLLNEKKNAITRFKVS